MNLMVEDGLDDYVRSGLKGFEAERVMVERQEESVYERER